MNVFDQIVDELNGDYERTKKASMQRMKAIMTANMIIREYIKESNNLDTLLYACRILIDKFGYVNEEVSDDN